MNVYTVTHKKVELPLDMPYQPVLVGNENPWFDGVIKDNTGENISHKNKNYCELTALYWIWKNKKEDFGLVHYRRYFASIEKGIPFKGQSLLSEKECLDLLTDYDIVLPNRRSFGDKTIFDDYVDAHHFKDLIILAKHIKNKFPEYLPEFQSLMSSHEIFLGNMFIGRKPILDEYCEWLFNILFSIEKSCDISHYNQYQSRLYGFLSERLFNVWVEHNRGRLKVKYLPIVYFDERQDSKRNIKSFLFRKRAKFNKNQYNKKMRAENRLHLKLMEADGEMSSLFGVYPD